jgi:hypothetical protein
MLGSAPRLHLIIKAANQIFIWILVINRPHSQMLNSMSYQSAPMEHNPSLQSLSPQFPPIFNINTANNTDYQASYYLWA